MGGWYRYTDTDEVPGWYNKDYHDKGVFLVVPTNLFEDHDSPRRYTYAMSPWTRDVAQNVQHRRTLFHLTKELMPTEFKANMEELKE